MNKRTVAVLLALIAVGVLAGCQKNPEEEIHGFEKWELQEPEYYTLADGKVAEEWINEDHTTRRFRMEDGTDLMEVSMVISLEADEEKKGLVGLPDMSETAQSIVKSYYLDQKETFDINERLQIAYQDYLDCEKNGEKFEAHVISQEVMPIAESERYVAFLTAVILPKADHYNGDSITVYDERIFDIDTGDTMQVQDLFKVDWEEMKKQLAALCGAEDTTVSDQDILEILDEADILIFQDYLEVWVPYGTWERQEFDKGFGLKYEKLEELLYSWAIPIASE